MQQAGLRYCAWSSDDGAAGAGRPAKPMTILCLRTTFGKKNNVEWNLTAILALMQVSPTHGAGASAKDATSPASFAGEAHPQERPAAFISQPPSGRPLLERCRHAAPLFFPGALR